MRRILDRMTGPAADPERARAAMVADQLRARGIADERVLAAMGAIPREAFVPDWSRRAAYADEALPIDAGQTISQPFMVARMTEDLAVDPGDRILEIGTGSGYQAAVLAWLGAHVTSLERQVALIEPARERIAALDLAGDVVIREADGSLGDAAGAPWDGIIVTAGAPAIPQELRDQLGRGRTTRHPRRHARSPDPDRRHAPRRRVGRALGRLLRLRPAHRCGRVGRVTPADPRPPGTVGILARP